MRSADEVRLVFKLAEEGCLQAEIARLTGVSRAQVRAWLHIGEEAVLNSPMRRQQKAAACDGSRCALVAAAPPPAYAYLLGQYLGDGCISAGPRGVFRLRISMCDSYPAIRAECEAAIAAIMPGHVVGSVQRPGCSEVYSSSKHWPCLFPQHGAGRKHERLIRLESWLSTNLPTSRAS